MDLDQVFHKPIGDNSKNYLFKIKDGIGINEKTKYEGIKIKNFYATYLLGPILILNPDFTKNILRKLGEKNPVLNLEKEIVESYKLRVEKMENPKDFKI